MTDEEAISAIASNNCLFTLDSYPGSDLEAFTNQAGWRCMQLDANLARINRQSAQFLESDRRVNAMLREHNRHEWFLNQVFCHRAMLQRYLRKYLNTEDDIEDVIQDAYLRIYAIKDYASVESPKAMLITIAHNLAIEVGRRRTGRATDAVADFEALGVSSNMPLLEEQLDARRRFEAFCAAVDSLPPVCRRVFVLRKVYKLSQAEIATVLGIAQSTIEKHVVKGLVRCRDYLRERSMDNENGIDTVVEASFRRDKRSGP